MGNLSGANDGSIPPGVYESILTDDLLAGLARLSEEAVVTSRVGEVDSPSILARHVARVVEQSLSGQSPEKQLDLANRILDGFGTSGVMLPGTVPELLLEIKARGTEETTLRPAAGLSAATLLTNARGEPSLGAEIRAEMASASEVDLLSAFIRWHGLRVIEGPLLAMKAKGVRLRVLTTTYMGATEKRAVDELVNRFGAEVKINYETNSTRLHAKAWMFRRASGSHTAYVGSSNLSHSALVEGLEWNVRISEAETPQLLRKFDATFESYWNDDVFEEYVPERDGDRLIGALRQGSKYEASEPSIDLAQFDVRPYPHQIQILEALESERTEHNRHRNLVIAATGTGKTVVAALDYVRLFKTLGDYPRLLFIAHRQEILSQSLSTYRAVLKDKSFGELLVDGKKPTAWRHVFASVQSLHKANLEEIKPDDFDVVVIDEFHHAEAPTYRRIMEHLSPKELLGLTATPERADGVDVRQEFFDGRAAAELRLWNALEADLLVPFHYFGIDDETDLTNFKWLGGKGYDTEALASLYTGTDGDSRLRAILSAVIDKVLDPSSMKALGFCASVSHAEYMAEKFNQAGISSVTVLGSTPNEVRRERIAALRRGEINCIFAVDVFNEGLDIPQIDTVLLLRPSQSATVFLQQLGRGLRRAPNKSVLTVLDFIGFHRKEFRFDEILRAMTGLTRARLVGDLKAGFPFLPAGSQIVLDQIVQERVLANVAAQVRLSQRDIVTDVRSYLNENPSLDLAGYLLASSRSLRDLYSKTTWSEVRQALEVYEPKGDAEVRKHLLGRMKSFISVDDQKRAEAYRLLASSGGPLQSQMNSEMQDFARMFLALLWPKETFDTLDEGFMRLRIHEDVADEIRQIVSISADTARRTFEALGPGLDNCVLQTHATYRREEILAALHWGSAVAGHQSGVAWCPDSKTDALLVTLHKSEQAFSPSTMYHDYALGPGLFHWQSQNATSSDSPTGQRYLDRESFPSQIVLFTRDVGQDSDGFIGTYTCLGQVDYVKHESNKPMSITWKLHRDMPVDVYQSASAVTR